LEAFLFYDTFNDTFDSSAQALKNLSPASSILKFISAGG
jgi:hypothetical protein